MMLMIIIIMMMIGSTRVITRESSKPLVRMHSSKRTHTVAHKYHCFHKHNDNVQYIHLHDSHDSKIQTLHKHIHKQQYLFNTCISIGSAQ